MTIQSPIHASLEAFYQDNEARRHSPEADYGVNWTEGRPFPRWRVSYIKVTGEIYAVELGGTGMVVVLGVCLPDPTSRTHDCYYKTLDALLEGWPDHCGAGGLGWIRQTLATVKEKEG